MTPCPTNDSAVVECVSCHKRTIWLEATDRNFNTGFCAYCGNRLEPTNDSPASVEDLIYELFGFQRENGEWVIPAMKFKKAAEATARINQLVMEAETRGFDKALVQVDPYISPEFRELYAALKDGGTHEQQQ